MRFHEENIQKIIENAQKILNISKGLKDILDSSSVDVMRSKTERIETLLLDTYCKNKRIMPARLNESESMQTEGIYKQYVDIFEMTEQCISFRIPILNNRFGYKNKELFDNIVRYVFLSEIEKGNQIPQMKKHTIVFTHVWPESSRDYILDNDNYDTRGVINNIVHFIGSSDSGLNSWQIHRTILSDELKMGTYIQVISRDI